VCDFEGKITGSEGLELTPEPSPTPTVIVKNRSRARARPALDVIRFMVILSRDFLQELNRNHNNTSRLVLRAPYFYRDKPSENHVCNLYISSKLSLPGPVTILPTRHFSLERFDLYYEPLVDPR
jgi:hypothetical protein